MQFLTRRIVTIPRNIQICVVGAGVSVLREKSLASFFTSLVFAYKSVSPKLFRIEQLCPSSDSMISLVFVLYATM